MAITYLFDKNTNRYICTDIGDKPSKAAVLLVSGPDGDPDSFLLTKASDFFNSHGLPTIRLAFFTNEPAKVEKERHKLLEQREVSISTYLSGFKTVLDFSLKRYEKVALIGHSLSAAILILFLQGYPRYLPKVELVLWDPSLLPWKKEWLEDNFALNDATGVYHNRYVEWFIGKTLYNEMLASENTIQTLANLDKATAIIAAQAGGKKIAQDYFSKLDSHRSRLVIIKGANHLFSGSWIRRQLFEATLKYLDNSNLSI